jgi:C4-dicarboxylate-specific signal transduction histidine kinase
VDPTIETALFQPFVTTKGKGKGRGLGLFVVQQLLDAEGCAISLLQKRNDKGRRYIFELDFSGALRDAE